MRLVATFGFELGGVGVGLVHVTGLHGQEIFLGRFAVCVLDFGDKVHELYRMAATDVVNLVGYVVGALGGFGYMVQCVDGAFGDVVNVGEVANHIAVVEHLDWFALGDCTGEEHGRHVRTSPRTVYGEESQTCDGQVVELAVAMRHELVALLAGGVQAHRIVNLVVFAVGHLAVEPVYGTRRGEHQVLDLVVAACLENVEEAD